MSTDRDRFAPGKLWSLWDFMQNLPLAELALLRNRAASLAQGERSQQSGFSADAIGDNGVELFKGNMQIVLDMQLHGIAPQGVKLATQFLGYVQPSNKAGEAIRQFMNVMDVLQNELEEHKSFILNRDEARYFGNERLCGDQVWEAFPTARMDVEEAGNCFALERYNAAVYHAVQAAEIGLRALARDRRITAVYRGKTPLSQAQWGAVLAELDLKINEIRLWKKGPSQSAALEFYATSTLEANKINDGWRTHISHGRGFRYEREEARSLLGHGDRLLRRLATRIGENKKPTPKVWRSPSVGLSS